MGALDDARTKYGGAHGPELAQWRDGGSRDA
jgi:hypothetical protein